MILCENQYQLRNRSCLKVLAGVIIKLAIESYTIGIGMLANPLTHLTKVLILHSINQLRDRLGSSVSKDTTVDSTCS